MPSKTSRTLQAAVMAAGFAAMGAGAAMATESDSRTALPERPQDIGAELPLHSCQSLAYQYAGSEIVPCADITAKAGVRNVLAQPAYTVEGTALALADQFVTPGPLLDVDRVNRLSGAVGHEVDEITDLQTTRPDISLDVAPGNTGVLDEGSRDSLLQTRIWERPENHSGFSAADTALEVNAVRGYTIGQPVEANGLTRPVTAAVSQTPLNSAPTLPETAELPLVGPLADRALDQVTADLDSTRQADPLGEVTDTVGAMTSNLNLEGDSALGGLTAQPAAGATTPRDQEGGLGNLGVATPVGALTDALLAPQPKPGSVQPTPGAPTVPGSAAEPARSPQPSADPVSDLLDQTGIDPAALLGGLTGQEAPSTLPAPAGPPVTDAVQGVADGARALSLNETLTEAKLEPTALLGGLGGLGGLAGDGRPTTLPAPAESPVADQGRTLPLAGALDQASDLISTNPVGGLVGNMNSPQSQQAAPAAAPEPTVEYHVRDQNKQPEINALRGTGLGELFGGELTLPAKSETPQAQPAPAASPAADQLGGLTQTLTGTLPL
ncbi:hypothetical protein FHR81_004226 [Actinoalloteichus hoggarensis]|uniref:Uncharacterized protein n=1 Tax=Actinoalloteichus hoggarensis TaxID=1470176 RepID=A0A221WAU9_9PSEU|nr:hypothetical protein [Actinoalloteichus hoggarensis]ASO22417.1 hypothetical protein AHOG_24055 [Actinoalloteichus hoggarensis]MBB5923159.1 hypothetical protein [Actinoalloteichus hoggarensis]